MTIYIGELPIYYVSSFEADQGSKNIEDFPFLGIDTVPHLSESRSSMRNFEMTGTLLQDSGVIPTIDDMAEDILAIRDRRAHFNYLHDFQGRSGWIGVKNAGSPKDASSLVTRPYFIEGKFLSKSLYRTRMHSYPIIRTNGFSFTLGVDDCDNYIAIPIGATYSGGDSSSISRTSKDGTITLVKATTNNDIEWDIGEADRLNGECKVYDMMSANLLKNNDVESWSAGASAAPDGWTLSNATVARESTIIHNGTYSAKITANGIWAYLYQSISSYAQYAGKTVTLGCRVYAPSTNDKNQTIKIDDGVGSASSSVIPKDDAWHWITVTRTIDASATKLETILYSNVSAVSDTDDVLYIDGVILVEGSEAPTTPVLDTYGIQVYNRDKEFTGSMIIENGLYRIMLNPSTDHITLYYWDGSDYVYISAFTAGTYTRATIVEINPDIIRIKLDSDVDIEIRRGHPPMIDTGTTDLVTISLTPANQTTTTENYLILATNVYICSDELFSLVNATKNCDNGKKWIFYETVGATAEDIAHQAMVNARQTRELIQR